MRDTEHLLLVEDDDVDFMTVARALQELGSVNPLDRIADGVEALAFLRDPANPRPGLILLDLNMPRMNGIELLGALKADEQLRSIPVVVLTTSGEEYDRVRAFSHSAAGFFVKPVDYPRFVSVMRDVRNYWVRSECATP